MIRRLFRAGVLLPIIAANAACEGVPSASEGELDSLVRELQTPDTSRRREVRALLLSLGEASVHPLLRVFPERRIGMQIFLIRSVHSMKDSTPPHPGLHMSGQNVPPYPIEAETLIAIGAPAVPKLVDALGEMQEPERLAVEDVLTHIGRPAVPLLARTVGARTKASVPAAEALGFMQGEAREAIPQLLEALGSEDPVLTSACVRALLRVAPRSSDVRAAILRALATSKDEELRTEVGAALKAMEGDQRK